MSDGDNNERAQDFLSMDSFHLFCLLQNENKLCLENKFEMTKGDGKKT